MKYYRRQSPGKAEQSGNTTKPKKATRAKKATEAKQAANLRIALGAAAAVAAAALFAYLGPSSGGRDYQIRNVLPLDDGRLLLVEGATYRRDPAASSSGSDKVYRRFTLVSPEGHVLARADESRPGISSWQDYWNLYGLVGNTLWIGQRGNTNKRVYARRLPDLAIVPGTRELIAQHPMLERRYKDYRPFVLGTVPEGLVVLGADQRVYVITNEGHVVQKPKEVACKPTQLCRWTENGREVVVRSGGAPSRPQLAGPLAGKHVRLGELDLIGPKLTAVSLADPLSVIVHSADFDAAGASTVLSRATGEGTGSRWQATRLLWSVSSRDLVQPVGLGPKSWVKLHWIHERGGRLVAVLEVRGGKGFSQHLVELDAATGARVAHQIIGAPPAEG